MTCWHLYLSCTLTTLTSAGKYEANQYLILARYVMTPSQRTLLTLHGEVTNG